MGCEVLNKVENAFFKETWQMTVEEAYNGT